MVERLLLDNMKDEVFILESTRSLDPETARGGAESLGSNGAAQSSHRPALD